MSVDGFKIQDFKLWAHNTLPFINYKRPLGRVVRNSFCIGNESLSCQFNSFKMSIFFWLLHGSCSPSHWLVLCSVAMNITTNQDFHLNLVLATRRVCFRSLHLIFCCAVKSPWTGLHKHSIWQQHSLIMFQIFLCPLAEIQVNQTLWQCF
jgi:hypothetical protein